MIKTEPTNNINFGIYKYTRQSPFGECMVGKYKNQNIEVYTKKEDNKLIYRFIYVSNKVKNFVKSKLMYYLGEKLRVLRYEGQNKSRY